MRTYIEPTYLPFRIIMHNRSKQAVLRLSLAGVSKHKCVLFSFLFGNHNGKSNSSFYTSIDKLTESKPTR